MVTPSLIYNVKTDFNAKIISFLGTISFLPQITGDVNRTTIITGLEIENDQHNTKRTQSQQGFSLERALRLTKA